MELKRDPLAGGGKARYALHVGKSSAPNRIVLSVRDSIGEASPGLQLGEREVDDLIVLLEYYKRVAKGEIDE